MRALVGLALLFTLASAQSCPPNYQLMEGNLCVRPQWLDDYTHLNATYPLARAGCAQDGAHLPIIKNDEENAAMNRIAEHFDDIDDIFIARVVLDLICDSSTTRIMWVDGTPVEYTPYPGIDLSFNCSQTTMASIPNSGEWKLFSTLEDERFAFFCIVETTVLPTIPAVTTTLVPTGQPTTGLCGDYSVMGSPLYGSCFKLFTDPLSWEAAQQKCAAGFGSLTTINSADENRFLWRTAIGYGILEGMHIGAHQSSENPSVWKWIGGEVPIEGKAYDNFISSFPIPGAGSCAAMMTENTAAQWINEDCKNDKLPFICRRDDFLNVPKTCPNDAPKAGEEFFPPGFPSSDIPCEYVLFVAAGKLVEIEIATLVAEETNDYLEILEGPAGPNVLANLTGTILTPTKFTTAQSNVVRVNWKPNNGGNDKGFKIRYNEVY